MTKSDLTQKREREREDWRRRSITGNVTALNPATKEITIQAHAREGNSPVVISAGGGGVRFRRYAPDSVRFSDARESSFADLKVGDQLRALGEKSADGVRLAAEEVVSGSFRTVAGAITAVNPETNEIKISDIQTRQLLAVALTKDSVVRRASPELNALLAGRVQGGSQSRAGGAGGAQSGSQSPAPANGADLQEMIERLPSITIAELKPGAILLISGTAGSDPTRVTAITLISGVEPLFASLQRSGTPRSIPNLGSMSMGTP